MSTKHGKRLLVFFLLILLAGVYAYFTLKSNLPPGSLPRKQTITVDNAKQNEIRFAVLGDSKILPNLSSWKGNRILNEAINQINIVKPELVFYLGDGPDRGGPKVYMTSFRSYMNGLESAWYPVIGNHEILGGSSPDGIHGNGENNFSSVFKDRIPVSGKMNNGVYYSLDVKNVHFIVLDTAWQNLRPQSPHTLSPGSSQWKWLVNDLQKARKTCTHIFIFTHEPAVSPFPAGGPDTVANLQGGFGTTWNNPEGAKAFIKLVTDYKVDAVFAGHIHMFNDLYYQGMHQIITAGAGANLYAKPEQGGYYHYLIVSVNGGNISFKVCHL